MADKHLARAVARIRKETLSVGALVEESLFKAFKAYEQRSATVAEEVVQADETIDEREIEIEEECLQVLAMYQPTGSDLRSVVSLMKINDELERIGDRGVNIAWQAHSLSYLRPVSSPESMSEMATKTKTVLRVSLEALVNLEIKGAWDVLSADDEIDALNRQHHEALRQQIEQSPKDTEALLAHLAVSRSLERIADHVTNLAEDVIYMVEGEIVRHGKKRRPGAVRSSS